MWALDVGLVFGTWITYSGAWLLAALALTSGSPILGGLIFACYWLGRAAPHWVEPLIWTKNPDPISLVHSVVDMASAMRWVHVYAVASFLIMLLVRMH